MQWFLIGQPVKAETGVFFQPIEEKEAMPDVQSYYKKTTAGEDQNKYVRMASEISNNNLDFILTLEAENGLFTPDRISKPNRNGTKDYGFCQLNSQYHWNFISSPDFKDPRKQLEYCYKVYTKRPTAFYGYYRRNNHKWMFELITS